MKINYGIKDNGRFTYNKTVISILYLIISTAILIFTFAIQNIPQQNWFFFMAYLITTHWIISTIMLLTFKINIISLSSFFIHLTYVFHFGQVILIGFFPYYKFQQFKVADIVRYETFQRATEFQIMIIAMVVWGILISMKPINIKNTEELMLENIYARHSNKAAILTGRLISIVCIPLRLRSDFLKMQASKTGDYFDVFSTAESGIASMFGYFAFVGIAILIIEYSKSNKKKAEMITIATILYLITSMLYGGRGQQLTIILFYVYVYFKCIRKLKLKSVIMLGILGWLLLILLNAIFMIRLNGFPTIDELIWAFQKSLASDPVLKIIEELGGTQYTVVLAMDKIKSLSEATLGTTYLSALPLVFINIKGALDPFIRLSHFARLLDTPYIGGTYIGELFYNFRYLGIILAPTIGWFVNYISQKVDRHIHAKDSIKIAYYIPLFTHTLWWVRDAFGGWVRISVWGGFIIYILYNILGKKFKIYKDN